METTPRPTSSRRTAAVAPEQTVEQIAAALEEFLAGHPAAAVLEDGKAIFDMRDAKYKLATEHGRCTLHLWSPDRNLVRRVSATTLRHGALRLSTHRFGQAKPQSLELVADRDRRTPSTREATRVKYLHLLERVLARRLPELKPDAFRTAMDLERSFGPAYARGSLVRGQEAWAVIAVNEEETQGTVDGILTLGILWLQHCRESGDGRRLYQGLKLIVPRGMAGRTTSRLTWLNPAVAQWELWELDQGAELLRQVTGESGQIAADASGALTSRLMHAPNQQLAQERFAQSIARVMDLVPKSMRERVDQRVRSGSELAFLLHGLEFARVKMTYAANTFNNAQELSFGMGANQSPLTDENASDFQDLVTRLFAIRRAGGDQRNPLFRAQPERWMESMLRRNLEPLDAHLHLSHLYPQVPALAAADHNALDLLGVTDDGRLAAIELRAEEDLQLVLQGLDYWARVRWHHLQASDPATGLGEFVRHGYFGGVRLSSVPARLYLVAPALRIHSATEIVLRHLSPQVEWTLVALDERWRSTLKTVWRKRSGA